MASRTMWLVMQRQEWGAVQGRWAGRTIPITISNDGPTAWMALFDDLDSATAWAPNAEVMAVRLVDRADEGAEAG